MAACRLPLFGALAVILWFITAPDVARNLESADLTKEQQQNWHRFWEEHQSHKLMMSLSSEFHPRQLAIVGVNVVPMTQDTLLQDLTVIVENGRFTAIGPTGEIEIPTDAMVVVGADDKYLIPGLAEAHSHTQISLSQFLVYLTRGVTTLREMDGFPWMLRAKEMAAQNRLLIPNLYVAGHILSHRAWGFYMTQIDTEEQAREVVREQADAGYDFIKIHNSMPEPLLGAVMASAKEAGLDVVGHVPHDITIAHGVDSGLRTGEHFKGYMIDSNLEITDEDYVAVTDGVDFWNTPTFTSYHEHLRGPEAAALAEKENSLRLVPKWVRMSWYAQADAQEDDLTKLRQTILPKSKEIFGNLWPVTRKFLAGTDTGYYAFMVPGYSLHEEVRIFQSLGLTPYESLETATVNPALAMRQESQMGTIEVGKRADFVVLDENPLEGAENLESIWGVSVRGTWLDRDSIRRIERALEESFADTNSVPAADPEVFEILVSEMEQLKTAGFPYPDYSLEEIETLLRELGQKGLAQRVDELQARRGVAIQTPF